MKLALAPTQHPAKDEFRQTLIDAFKPIYEADRDRWELTGEDFQLAVDALDAKLIKKAREFFASDEDLLALAKIAYAEHFARELMEALLVGACMASTGWASIDGDKYQLPNIQFNDVSIFTWAWDGHGPVDIYDAENPSELLGQLTRQGMEEGFQLLFDRYRDSYFDQVVCMNDDGYTHDAWLQLSVLKEIAY